MEAADDTTIRHVMVPDPSITDSQFYHEQAIERERADTLRIKPNLNVGKVYVARDMATLIGGLVHIRRRLSHHERAAERFLNLYEARYGRVAPAVDLGKVRVDTSIVGHDGEMVGALDATAAIQVVERGVPARGIPPVLEPQAFLLLVAVVCVGLSVSDATGKAGGRALDREVSALLAALDRLAEHWGMASRRVA